MLGDHGQRVLRYWYQQERDAVETSHSTATSTVQKCFGDRHDVHHLSVRRVPAGVAPTPTIWRASSNGIPKKSPGARQLRRAIAYFLFNTRSRSGRRGGRRGGGRGGTVPTGTVYAGAHTAAERVGQTGDLRRPTWSRTARPASPGHNDYTSRIEFQNRIKDCSVRR